MSDQSAPFQPIAFEGFSGLNTQAARPSIKDTEMAWCDGFMPIGDSTLRTIPGKGANQFYAGDGRTIEFFDFFNIGATPYCIVFLDDGSIWRFNTSNVSDILELAPPGTITSPIRQNVGVSEWGSQFAIIVANQPNGYFMTDGTVFFAPGGIAPTTPAVMNSGGAGYSPTPTLTVFGGSGSGVVLTPIISDGTITGLTVVNPGSGYAPGDIVQVGFSGGGASDTPILEAATSGGTVSGIAIVNGGTNLLATPPISIQGGGGTGATATVTVTGGVITAVSITNPGAGYTSAPAVVVTPGYNTAAYATLQVMPTGVQGSAVETYQSRVWIANTTQMLFSAPASYTDFSTSNGGGTFESSDSFLRVNYIRPLQTNGFLYLIADSSINYISNVNTSGSPPVTTFTNQNANPEVGTPFAYAIDVVGNNIVFANAFGAHVSYGGNSSKISGPLDGVYNSVPGFGGFDLSAAKHILYGKRVWILLMPIIDPITQTQVNKMFMWDEKRWWSTSQDVTVLYIQSQEVNSVISAYGTDGTYVFPMFAGVTAGFSKIVQSKLWSKPDGYLSTKSANRVWLVGQYNTKNSPNINFSVDSETNSSSVVLNPGTGGLAPNFYVSQPTAIGQYGSLLGMTISTDESDFTLISAAIDAVPVQYRG